MHTVSILYPIYRGRVNIAYMNTVHQEANNGGAVTYSNPNRIVHGRVLCVAGGGGSLGKSVPIPTSRAVAKLWPRRRRLVLCLMRGFALIGYAA